MMKRREFLAKSAYSFAGASLLVDPFIGVLAGAVDQDPEKFSNQFSHSCEIFREADLLRLKFHFVNLKPHCGKIRPVKKGNDCFMLVQLPSQHMAETNVPVGEISSPPTAQRRMAGFSWILARMKDEEVNHGIPYNEDSLLDFSKWEILTLDSRLFDQSKLEGKAPKYEKLSELGYPVIDDLFIEVAEKVKLPLTIIQIDRLALSPIAPFIPGERGRYDLGYQFLDDRNRLVVYQDPKRKKDPLRIVRPWENGIHYSVQLPDGQVDYPPHLKAVGYAGDPTGDEGNWLLDEGRRSEIVGHSLADFSSNARNLISEYLRFGALGLTGKWLYHNMEPIGNSSFIGYGHEIKNGRNIRVVAMDLGVDSLHNVKVVVSEIEQRYHIDGRSMVVYRTKVDTLDDFVSHSHAEYPFVKSTILTRSFYCKKLSIDGLDNDKIFIPIAEGGASNLADADVKDLRLLRHQSTDRQSGVLELSSPMVVVLKEKYDEEAIKKIRDFLNTKTAREKLFEDTQGNRVGFIEAQEKGISQNTSTSLKTKKFHIIPEYQSEFNLDSPVKLKMVSAEVQVPQLEQLNVKAKKYHLFRYSGAVRDADDDKFKTNEVYFEAIEWLEKGDAKPKPIRDLLDLPIAQTAVNTAPVVSHLSRLDQGLSFDDSVNITGYKNSNSNNAGQSKNSNSSDANIKTAESLRSGDQSSIDAKIKTAEFLRSGDQKIFNSIDLLDILPKEMSPKLMPVYTLVNEANDGIAVLREMSSSLRSYAKQYDDLVKELRDTERLIGQRAQELASGALLEVEEQIEQWLALKKQKVIRELRFSYQSIDESNVLVNVEDPKESIIKIIQENTEELTAEFKEILPTDVGDLIGFVVTLLRYNFPLAYNIGSGRIQVAPGIETELAAEITRQFKVLRFVLNPAPPAAGTQDKGDGSILNPAPPAAGTQDKGDGSNSINYDIFKKNDTKWEDRLKIIVQFLDKTDGNGAAKLASLRKEFQRKLDIESDRALKLELQSALDFVIMNYYEAKVVLEEELDSLEKPPQLTQLTKEVNAILKLAVVEVLEKHYDKDTYEKVAKVLEELGFDVPKGENKLDYFINSLRKQEAAALKQISEIRENIKNEIKGLERRYEDLKSEVDLRARSTVDGVRRVLEEKRAELNEAIRDSEAGARIDSLQTEVGELKLAVEKMLECSRKSFSYKWSLGADSFKNYESDFVSFYATPYTSLSCSVESAVNYDLSLDAPPKVRNTEFSSNTTLKGFGLVFFNALKLNVRDLRFEVVNGRSPDFDIDIRSVEFGGPLAFVNGFKSLFAGLDFLATLAHERVSLSYQLDVPDIKSGAFELKGLVVGARAELPIGGGDKPLRLDFNISSPNHPFSITVGKYTGRGCFAVGMSAKYGIDSLLFVFEFGGVIEKRLGPAKGSIYLFAGIYYRKLTSSVEIKAYIIAGGVFDLGPVSASLAFVLSLSSTAGGKKLEGSCTVRYSVKIFMVKKSWTITYRDEIEGLGGGGSNSGDKNLADVEKSNGDGMDLQFKPTAYSAPSHLWREFLTSFIEYEK